MNIWYIAAILFGAITAFCTYYGSVMEGRRSSQEQTFLIESRLQNLGTQIQELRAGPNVPSQTEKIKEADLKYKALAEDFLRSISLRKAKEEERTAKQQVEEIQKTQEVEAYFQIVKREVEKLAAAYNNSAGKMVLEIKSKAVPENLFRPSGDHPAYILLMFSNSKYWGIRIVSYLDRTLALQFVRLLSPDGAANYQTMKLTNDSINLIFLKDQFGISLNQYISDSVKANITDGLPKTQLPLDKFEPTAADIARKIVEFELLSLVAKK